MSEKEESKLIERVNELLLDPAYVKQNWHGRSTDPLLQWLVGLTNSNNSTFAVTLTVGGNLVSGMLISLDEYLNQYATQISAQIGHEESAAVIRDQVLSWKPAQNEENPVPQLIHLKDAEVFTSNGMPIAPGGTLWRGKISSVDGFNLGRLVTGKAN